VSAASASLTDVPHSRGVVGLPSEPPTIAAEAVGQRFGRKQVLRSVSFEVQQGGIHALLGPNGAGKTTLIRILAGLLVPSEGVVRIFGAPADSSRAMRRLIGFVPSGDRTFYLRISGLENLAFFARLHGMSRRAAASRASEVLEEVGLADAATTRVGFYSHGMQKRLSVARALLAAPPILLVDEATHDLDPDGARRVRELVAAAAERGAAVIWATQRLDEIRGFADRVTLLAEGQAAFAGTVAEMMAIAVPRRYLLRLTNGRPAPYSLESVGSSALGSLGRLEHAGDTSAEHYVLSLADDVILGDALSALASADIDVLTCREERSEIEQAFLALAGGAD
jgi:ABC-type multidrug transport system ATPase subunit